MADRPQNTPVLQDNNPKHFSNILTVIIILIGISAFVIAIYVGERQNTDELRQNIKELRKELMNLKSQIGTEISRRLWIIQHIRKTHLNKMTIVSDTFCSGFQIIQLCCLFFMCISALLICIKK